MTVKEYIKQHNHINYCEAIIYPDGTIEDAIPSHTEKLFRIINISKQKILDIMPEDASPLAWLVDYTNCVSIWFDNGFIPENITKAQINSINELLKHNIIKKPYVAYMKKEKSIIERNQYFIKTGEFIDIYRKKYVFIENSYFSKNM